jgi:hypothetical protein
MKLTANIFSILFHPILMPLLGFFIILNSGIYESNIPIDIKKYAYLITALFTIFLPTALITLLLYMHQIQSFELSQRRERTFPLIFMTISFLLLYIIVSKILPIRIIKGFTFSMLVTSFLLVLSTYKFKLSMHLIGLGGISGLVIAMSIKFQIDLFFILAIILIISGIVGSSRLYLNAHNLYEVFAGFGLGFLGTFVVLLYYIQ